MIKYHMARRLPSQIAAGMTRGLQAPADTLWSKIINALSAPRMKKIIAGKRRAKRAGPQCCFFRTILLVKPGILR